MTEVMIKNDEPTKEDRLGRSEYAKTFARIARTCGTPMVIGLYGRWGVGKTSLMELIRAEFDSDNSIQPVWFDAWRHQFDENPVMGLLHTLVADLGIEEEVKTKLFTITRALGSGLLKTAVRIDPNDIVEALNRYDEENFKIQEERVRLYEYFQQLISKAQTAKDGQKRRIVFFIDDLDRCTPDHILSVLEALKLYLNLKGCVYFLGLDRHTLEDSIRHHYEDRELDAVSYLDKIIQLPFTIPQVAPDSMKSFIGSLLPSELGDCEKILEHGLGGNPRRIKRFINTLLLNHHLASTKKLPKYQPAILATLLLIQDRNPELYFSISRKPSLLINRNTEEGKSMWETHIEGDEYLEHVLDLVTFPDAENLKSYIYLTDVAGIVTEVLQDYQGFYTEEGLDQLLAISGKLSDNEVVCDKLLLYKTRTQHTWLVTTNKNLFCFLDDKNTRRRERVIQWVQPLSAATRLHVRAYTETGQHVIDIGNRKGWRYSDNLYNSEELVEKVETMINDAFAMQ